MINVKDEVKTRGIFMGTWNTWSGCHRYSTGCKYCYIHKGDYKKVSHSRKNRHGKASKNGMKQSISLKCSTFDSHLFHGSLDNEPLAVWVRAIRRNSPQGGSPWQKPTTQPNSLSSDFRGINAE